MIRDQYFNQKEKSSFFDLLPKKIKYSIYTLSVKEWNLGRIMNKIYWEPLKWGGNRLNFLSPKNLYGITLTVFFSGIVLLVFKNSIPPQIHANLPAAFSFFGLLLILKSFTERNNTTLSWILIIFNHLFTAIAISFNEYFTYSQTLIYLSGVMAFGLTGLFILKLLNKKEKNIDMNQFRGHVYEHPYLAFFFLICCLAVEGFPITPTFIGEEIIFDHIYKNQILLAVFTATSFIVIGLSAIRIYARLFLGPHVKTYHEIAYRSS
jgi:hypothetical protein